MSPRIAMAAARGILLSFDKTKLVEFGGHVQLNRHWAYALLKRMKFVQRKATTAKSIHTAVDFAQLKKSFLADVVATVTMEEIPAENRYQSCSSSVCIFNRCNQHLHTNRVKDY